MYEGENGCTEIEVVTLDGLVKLKDFRFVPLAKPCTSSLVPALLDSLIVSIMSRVNAALGVLVAGLCGVATGPSYIHLRSILQLTFTAAYVTLQPEFEKQKSEQDGDFKEQHPKNDQAISQAILSDMKEAEHQVVGEGKGFAWGIREAIWGPSQAQQSTTTPRSDEKSTEGQNKEQQSKI